MKKKIISKNSKESIFCLSTLSFVFLLVLGCFIFHSNTVNAKENASSEKYYTSVYIEPGDTLTSIAKEYQTEEYSDLSEYIEEIMYINQLYSDDITAGCYLVIPYYSKEVS